METTLKEVIVYGLNYIGRLDTKNTDKREVILNEMALETLRVFNDNYFFLSTTIRITDPLRGFLPGVSGPSSASLLS